MTLPIKNLAIGGYRSFGKEIQYFDNFEKVNLFIGRNNSGKSNILRFISDVLMPVTDSDKITLDKYGQFVYHLPDKPAIIIGHGEKIENLRERLLDRLKDKTNQYNTDQVIKKILDKKYSDNNSEFLWSFRSSENNIANDFRYKAIKSLEDIEIVELKDDLNGPYGGHRQREWEPFIIKILESRHSNFCVATIPAFRQIGEKGTFSLEFDGTGIIERLAKLQNPDVHNQDDKERFIEIRDFVRSVIDSPDAEIQIPHERDTILVHMEGKLLPIDSLGTGIHEVIILASAATVLNDYVICVEEPEIHLNPILQKKLLKYLIDHTSNQYFISTHSAAFMDTKGVEIYHVRLENAASVVERVTSDNHRSAICEDLGYHPSDLLQANCVIWVEGPSDRIYLNYWIHKKNQEYIEGIHYSIMFYGGKLSAHLTNDDLDEIVDDLISLRRLNRRGVILIDSDKAKKGERINETKQRLKTEFDSGPGHAWITDGREIENYIPQDQLRVAISSVSKNATLLSNFEKYDNCLRIKGKKGEEKQARKVEVARYVTEHFEPNYEIYDLKLQIEKLMKFIKASNP